ncbi:MAG: VacJ family lipoprotein [Pseudomonadota bacterium]
MLDFVSSRRRALIRILVAGVLVAGLTACARPPADHPPEEAYDPYEERNRAVHEFNRQLDRNLVRPAGIGYSTFLPDDIETPLSRLAGNLSLPSDMVNNVLQLEMRAATGNFYRFLVNSTVGVFGLFDPATEMGLPDRTRTNFGATLHDWGVREGAYLELPFVGPSNQRDTAGFFVDLAINPLRYVLNEPWNYVSTLSVAADGLSRRGRFSDTIDSILYESADSYAQSKTLYIQNRRFELSGGDAAGFEDPYDQFAPGSDPYDQFAPDSDPYDQVAPGSEGETDE